MNRPLYLLALPLAITLTGCPKERELTSAEAQESLQQAAASSQAESLAAASIDISTNFTIGGAVENAALELKTFVASQLPCADVTLANATLTIEYGVNPGTCLYRGHTFSGTSAVTVSKNAMNEVVVDHVWTGISNGVVELDGTAHGRCRPPAQDVARFELGQRKLQLGLRAGRVGSSRQAGQQPVPRGQPPYRGVLHDPLGSRRQAIETGGNELP